MFVNIFANFRHCCLLDFRWFWSTQHSSLILYNIHEMSNSMIYKSFHDWFHLVCSGKQACSSRLPVALSWLPSQNQLQQLLQRGIRPLLRDFAYDFIRPCHHTADKRNEDSVFFWDHCKVRSGVNVWRSSVIEREKKSEDLIAFLCVGILLVFLQIGFLL